MVKNNKEFSDWLHELNFVVDWNNNSERRSYWITLIDNKKDNSRAVKYVLESHFNIIKEMDDVEDVENVLEDLTDILFYNDKALFEYVNDFDYTIIFENHDGEYFIEEFNALDDLTDLKDRFDF